MEIRNGLVKDADGGGIWNGGNLILQNVRVNDNQATQGGGIWNKGKMILKDVKISDNAGIYTDGIENVGVLILKRADLYYSSDFISKHGYIGIALLNKFRASAKLNQVNIYSTRGISNEGTLILINSALYFNEGGIRNGNGILRVKNATFSSNDSDANGATALEMIYGHARRIRH